MPGMPRGGLSYPFGPFTVVVRSGFYDGFDELHTADSVVHIRKIRPFRPGRFPAPPGPARYVRNSGKCSQRLRCNLRDVRRACGCWLLQRLPCKHSRYVRPPSSVVPFDVQRIRFHLCPFDAAFFAIDPDRQRIFFTGGYLGCDQHAGGASVETEQCRAVVVEQASFHDCTQVGAERCASLPGDVFGQLQGMSADISHRSRFSGADGSVRHPAFEAGSSSTRVESHPCVYSTNIFRIFPKSPRAKRSRASLTPG